MSNTHNVEHYVEVHVKWDWVDTERNQDRGDRFKAELVITDIYETILSSPKELYWFHKVEGMDSLRDERVVRYIEQILAKKGWGIYHYNSTWQENSGGYCGDRTGVIFRIKNKNIILG